MKRWEIEGNEKDGIKHVLYFTFFYEEDNLAEIYKGKDNDFIYDSEFMGKECEYLESEDLENAKDELINIIKDYFSDKVDYFSYMSRAFGE